MAVCLAFSRPPLTSPNRCHSPKAGVQASTASAIRRSYWTAFASRCRGGSVFVGGEGEEADVEGAGVGGCVLGTVAVLLQEPNVGLEELGELLPWSCGRTRGRPSPSARSRS